jgi:hypothetical protein
VGSCVKILMKRISVLLVYFALQLIVERWSSESTSRREFFGSSVEYRPCLISAPDDFGAVGVTIAAIFCGRLIR